MRKHIVLISVGVLNVLHGSFHIVQFIQSMFFVAYASHGHDHDESFIEEIMHNPVFALIMGVIGILTLVIGIKDYRHHKKCSTNHTLPVLSLEDKFKATMEEGERLHRLIQKNKEIDEDSNNNHIYWD